MAGVRSFRALDAAAAFAVLVAAWATMRLEPEARERALDAGAGVLVMLMSVGVLTVRRWRLAGVLLVGAALATYTALDYTRGPILVGASLTVYLLDLAGTWRQGAGAGLLLALCAVDWRSVVGATAQERPGWPEMEVVGWSGALAPLAFALLWLVLPLLAAEVVKARDERVAARARQATAAREKAAAEERLGIAQDLHDTVAHALSAISLQARAGVRQVGSGPGSGPLDAIAELSASAATDLGTLVHGLRGGAQREPLAMLDDVPELIDQARRSGQSVQSRPASIDPLPAPVSVAAYRVVQEALTNARRHAPGARSEVELSDRDGLVVAVRNSAAQERPEPTDPGGVGLVGMRERVEGTGGTLSTGPLGDGGWEVVARWPLHRTG